MNCWIFIDFGILLDVELLSCQSLDWISVHLQSLQSSIAIDEFRTKIEFIKVTHSDFIKFYNLTASNSNFIRLALCHT